MLSVLLVSVNMEMTAACECQITQWFMGFGFRLAIVFSHIVFRDFGKCCMANRVCTNATFV